MLSAGPIARGARRIVRHAAPFIVAIAIATGGSVALRPETTVARSSTAGAPKVVIVVGPSGASTTRYLRRARTYAAQARRYGARVIEIYTPRATWTRVVAAAQGANVLIYLGHGNGWPSPYAPFQGRTKDGLGLNLTPRSGNTKPTYYGEDRVATTLRLAPGAVVLLGHLCYASGNGEPGSRQPTWRIARRRVDNYAAGFLRAGASAVIADGHGGLLEELGYLFGRARPLVAAWRTDPGGNDNVRRIRLRADPRGRGVPRPQYREDRLLSLAGHGLAVGLDGHHLRDPSARERRDRGDRALEAGHDGSRHREAARCIAADRDRSVRP